MGKGGSTAAFFDHPYNTNKDDWRCKNQVYHGHPQPPVATRNPRGYPWPGGHRANSKVKLFIARLYIMVSPERSLWWPQLSLGWSNWDGMHWFYPCFIILRHSKTSVTPGSRGKIVFLWNQVWNSWDWVENQENTHLKLNYNPKLINQNSEYKWR
jgi:hypothetical protein